ncbi:MAG: phenylalanine--tRNA ligase subunit beta [Ignavibacteriaceae bacterium]
MKISLNWLKDYIDLTGISTTEIADKLTMSGLEVEDVIDQNKIYKDFIVGYIKDKKKHPNADKLSLCTVSDGKEDYQVICGAPNVDAEQKVVFAPIGTTIPKGNFKISKAKIRGVESFGMICSEAELELSDDHSGIMVLSNGVKEGTLITEALSLNDVIFEIGITPNRPDALSHIGVARDLAAIFNLELKLPSVEIEESSEDVNKLAKVEIIDEINCPRYSSKIVTDVLIKDSPQWMKTRLKNIGLRPINNIVDVSNYVMYETGQPLHAFDLDNLEGRKIVVQSTTKETNFITLDSKERKLPSGTLMICDAEKNVAVAGVMGGENSEVNSNTKNILIESAYFNPSSIRKTSKNIGLSTEASYRFERGTDPNNTDFSVKRAAKLISELSGGKAAKGIIDIYPNKIERKEVRIRFARVNKLLGFNIGKDTVIEILKKLGMKIIFESEEEYRFLVPTFRPDIEREVDLIEEIARINGYDNIPTQNKISITLEEKTDESEVADNIRNISVGLGFFEIINNPLQGEKFSKIIGSPIEVLNPQSLDMQFLRTSLIPGGLETISRNIKVGEKKLSMFEIGNVFNKKENKEIESFEDFTEESKLLFLVTGLVSKKEWNEPEVIVDFYHLKGLVNEFLFNFLLDNVLNDSYYHNVDRIFDYRFEKSYKNLVIGSGGKVKKDVLKLFDIEQDVYCFEFSINLLQQISGKSKTFSELNKFPKVFRDFAFVFDKRVKYSDVKEYIKEKGSGILRTVEIFDLFESDKLGQDKKSMAFSLEYYSKERTLTEEEVEKDFSNLIIQVEEKFNATLRGN